MLRLYLLFKREPQHCCRRSYHTPWVCPSIHLLVCLLNSAAAFPVHEYSCWSDVFVFVQRSQREIAQGITATSELKILICIHETPHEGGSSKCTTSRTIEIILSMMGLKRLHRNLGMIKVLNEMWGTGKKKKLYIFLVMVEQRCPQRLSPPRSSLSMTSPVMRFWLTRSLRQLPLLLARCEVTTANKNEPTQSLSITPVWCHLLASHWGFVHKRYPYIPISSRKTQENDDRVYVQF